FLGISTPAFAQRGGGHGHGGGHVGGGVRGGAVSRGGGGSVPSRGVAGRGPVMSSRGAPGRVGGMVGVYRGSPAFARSGAYAWGGAGYGRPGSVYAHGGYGYARGVGRAVGPIHFVRPYYSFRPRLNVGFGIWAGYPFAYANS